MNPPLQPVQPSEDVSARLEKAFEILATIQRCEAELDTVFFERRSFSIPPPPVQFFRGTSRLATSDVPPAMRTSISSISTAQIFNRGPSFAPESDNVGHRIRACREAAGMTQKQLAEATGIRRPNIARLEKGANLPNLATINRIAAALSTTPVALLSGDPPPINPEA